MKRLEYLITVAESAARERNEPIARMYLREAGERREQITKAQVDVADLKVMDERIKFVWRWLNPH